MELGTFSWQHAKAKSFVMFHEILADSSFLILKNYANDDEWITQIASLISVGRVCVKRLQDRSGDHEEEKLLETIDFSAINQIVRSACSMSYLRPLLEEWNSIFRCTRDF